MPVYYKDKNGNICSADNPKGRPHKVRLAITIGYLADLFKVSPRTIHGWIKAGRLVPTDIFDIVNKYNNPHLLDKRKSNSKVKVKDKEILV